MRRPPRRPPSVQLPPETATTAGCTELDVELLELDELAGGTALAVEALELDELVLDELVLGALELDVSSPELAGAAVLWCAAARARLALDRCRECVLCGEVSNSTRPVPVPLAAVLALVELLRVWPDAVCATTSVRTPAPISAATAIE
jgi:hypothetical protein